MNRMAIGLMINNKKLIIAAQWPTLATAKAIAAWKLRRTGQNLKRIMTAIAAGLLCPLPAMVAA